MAKRKRKKISGVRRRQRMHGVGAVDFTNVLGVIAGAVAGSMLNKVVPSTVDPRLVSGGKLALGVALPMFSKSGSTKNILAGVGAGMVAVGSVELIKAVAPTMLSGLGEDDFISVSLDGIGESVLAEDVLSGDIDVINGDISVVSGEDEDDEDYMY
jgi:hypothetical protein